MTTDPTQSEPMLVLEHAQKRFGAVRALEDGDIALHAGEVHGLVGENGAGKSTLVKILAGVHRPDAGRLVLDGEEAIFDNAKQSQAAGIAIIFQEPTLFPDLSVAENIFVGMQPLKRFRRIDGRRMRREAAAVFDQLGVRLDPDRLARGLSIADQQLVEIAKALTTNARVIVMDEPTAALTTSEVERLFRIVEALRSRGNAVLFVSHRLEEIFAICQRVTVMRDGRHVLTQPIEELTVQSIIRAMVGRDMDALFPKVPAEPGRTVLKVERLTREGVFTDVSFEVRAGEVVALAGLVGAGRTEVARAIFGIDRFDAGSVEVDGRRLPAGSPTAAMAAGVGLVPEDRRQQGLVMDFSIERNIALTSLDHVQRGGLIPRGAERRFAKDWALRLQLKYGRLTNPVWTLSGGNQQKAVLAKWLARKPSLLIVDEPTRGIDVGTKAEVHRLLSELAAQGVAVLMISSELPEVLGMADRIVVLFEGRVMREFARDEADENAIMHAATGLVEEAA
jgi:rhamnose transport system ATP-binding protein